MAGGQLRAACRAMPATRKACEPVRMCVRECLQNGIGALTLFAFSSENWGRPSEEVGALMGLFWRHWTASSTSCTSNGVRVTFIGDRQGFPVRLQARMAAARSVPPANQLQLQVAVGYGGRWDIVNAARQLARAAPAARCVPRTSPTRRWAPAAAAGWRAGSGPVHPHRWRAAHQQLPAVEPGLHRAVLLRRAVAGFRCGGLRAPRCRTSPAPASLSASPAPAGRGRVIRQRIISAVVIAVLLVGAVLLLPPVWSAVALSLVLLAARLGVVRVPDARWSGAAPWAYVALTARRMCALWQLSATAAGLRAAAVAGAAVLDRAGAWVFCCRARPARSAGHGRRARAVAGVDGAGAHAHGLASTVARRCCTPCSSCGLPTAAPTLPAAPGECANCAPLVSPGQDLGRPVGRRGRLRLLAVLASLWRGRRCPRWSPSPSSWASTRWSATCPKASASALPA